MAIPPQAAQAAAQQIGNIIQGFGTWQSKRAQASQLKRGARMARGEASQEAQLAVDEMERAGARAAVTAAATGGGFEGSAAGVLENLERTGVFNARSAIYAGNVEAENLLYQAKVAKQEGTMALVSAFFQAGSSLAGDRMRAAETRKQEAARRTLYVKGYGR